MWKFLLLQAVTGLNLFIVVLHPEQFRYQHIVTFLYALDVISFLCNELCWKRWLHLLFMNVTFIICKRYFVSLGILEMFILQEFSGKKFSPLRPFFQIQGIIYLVLSYHVYIKYFAKSLDTFDENALRLISTQIFI